jgi:hypothetical protein
MLLQTIPGDQARLSRLPVRARRRLPPEHANTAAGGTLNSDSLDGHHCAFGATFV